MRRALLPAGAQAQRVQPRKNEDTAVQELMLDSPQRLLQWGRALSGSRTA